MSNRIMYISFPTVADNIAEVKESIVVSIEDDESLEGKLFFFVDRKEHEAFFTSDKQEKIAQYISSKLEIDKDEAESFIHDWVDWQYEVDKDSSDDYRTFGKITISEESFYSAFYDEILSQDEYIKKLVNAGKDFYSELNKLRKETITYLFNLAVDESRQEFGRLMNGE